MFHDSRLHYVSNIAEEFVGNGIKVTYSSSAKEFRVFSLVADTLT